MMGETRNEALRRVAEGVGRRAKKRKDQAMGEDDTDEVLHALELNDLSAAQWDVVRSGFRSGLTDG